jgi:uncharacterized membrane protein YgcG
MLAALAGVSLGFVLTFAPLSSPTAGIQGQAAVPASVEIEFFGTVQALSGTSLVVSGQIIEAVAGLPIPVGQSVRVVAALSPTGTLTAREIQPLATTSALGIVRLKGTLGTFNNDFMLLTGADGSSSLIETGGLPLVAPGTPPGTPLTLFAVSTGPGLWRALAVDDDGVSAAAADGQFVVGPAAQPFSTGRSSLAPVPTAITLPTTAAPAPLVTPIPPVSTPDDDDGTADQGRGDDGGSGDDSSGNSGSGGNNDDGNSGSSGNNDDDSGGDDDG